jgi:hypothetical protein
MKRLGTNIIDMKYYYKGKLIGMKIGRFGGGSLSQTPTNAPLQILSWNHPKGYKCIPHFHKPMWRITRNLNECFVVQKGKVRFKLYGDDGVHFKTIILKAGDVYLYVSGGHEAEALTECIMFEVKNGPYKEDKVKI